MKKTTLDRLDGADGFGPTASIEQKVVSVTGLAGVEQFLDVLHIDVQVTASPPHGRGYGHEAKAGHYVSLSHVLVGSSWYDRVCPELRRLDLAGSPPDVLLTERQKRRDEATKASITPEGGMPKDLRLDMRVGGVTRAHHR